MVKGAGGIRSTNVHPFIGAIAGGGYLVIMSMFFKYFYSVGGPWIGAESSQFTDRVMQSGAGVCGPLFVLKFTLGFMKMDVWKLPGQ